MKVGSSPEDEGIPAWQRQSLDRSLQSARARARARSSRFVTAAIKLLRERGNADFTVQDVVNQSKMSIRTFYQYFASKEDLLVAVCETGIALEAVPRLRKRVEKQKDPLLRVRAYIETVLDLSAKTGAVGRTLTSFQNRLAETRPDDLDRAMQPQFDLLTELIEDVARTRTLRPGLTVEMAARMTHYTVLAAARARVLKSERAPEIPAQKIWEYCVSGMGFDVETSPARPRS